MHLAALPHPHARAGFLSGFIAKALLNFFSLLAFVQNTPSIISSFGIWRITFIRRCIPRLIFFFTIFQVLSGSRMGPDEMRYQACAYTRRAFSFSFSFIILFYFFSFNLHRHGSGTAGLEL